MCAHIDKHATKEFKKQRRKTFYGWKVINSNGFALYAPGYLYAPGVFRTKFKHYSQIAPRGIHVYATQEAAENERKITATRSSTQPTVLRVLCRVSDVFGTEPQNWCHRQIVMRKITITKADWLRAGLPMPLAPKTIKKKAAKRKPKA